MCCVGFGAEGQHGAVWLAGGGRRLDQVAGAQDPRHHGRGSAVTRVCGRAGR
jgi:hypothetical protein